MNGLDKIGLTVMEGRRSLVSKCARRTSRGSMVLPSGFGCCSDVPQCRILEKKQQAA
jgi:hypothetical protein